MSWKLGGRHPQELSTDDVMIGKIPDSGSIYFNFFISSSYDDVLHQIIWLQRKEKHNFLLQSVSATISIHFGPNFQV